MVKRIRFCYYCKIYTLKEHCPICRRKTIIRKPPRFGPEDVYGEYRRKMKKELGIYLSRELEKYMFEHNISLQEGNQEEQ